MDFLKLAALFLGAGLAALAYYRFVPDATTLRARLPNRVTAAGLVLALAVGLAAWFWLSSLSGIRLVGHIFFFIFALLFFESLFLLLMRWIRKTTVAVILAMAVTALVFWWYQRLPSFYLLNSIIIISTLGAVTLLTRLGYLRTKILFVVAGLWTLYDIMLTHYLLPEVTRETTTPYPSFLYPAVTVGQISLGSGDFMFLALFTLVTVRDFGTLAGVSQVVAQVCGLLITGLLLPERGYIVPFLAVMTPIFFLGYAVLWYLRLRQPKKT